jgi:hypothetical protein
MNVSVKKAVNEVSNFVFIELEGMFKVWQIVSWIMLLMGYSLLIVAYTLFGEPPIWLVVCGLAGIVVTLVNFFLALFVALLYVAKGLKEKDMDLVKNKVLITIGYNAVAGLMYFAITL